MNEVKIDLGHPDPSEFAKVAIDADECHAFLRKVGADEELWGAVGPVIMPLLQSAFALGVRKERHRIAEWLADFADEASNRKQPVRALVFAQLVISLMKARSVAK